MDVFAGLLDGPRARGAFILRAVFAPPWSIRVDDEAALSVIVLLRGAAFFAGSEQTVVLAPGDIVLARGTSSYRLSDAIDTADDIRILPGQVCIDPHGHLLNESMALGVRTWGNSTSGETTMLIGTYQRATEVGAHVLSRLPSDVLLRGLDTPLTGLLATEATLDTPGQAPVLDRLLDLLVVTCLREIFSSTSDAAPTWYSAREDPVVGRATQLMHHHPATPWTLASLAESCAVSRATLARRFTRLVGEPPMTFLSNYRITLAADLLANPNTTIASIAAQVGYSTPFALSAAFKRLHGVAPSEYRHRRASDQTVA